MSPQAIEQTKQNNAMRDAFNRAQIAPKKPALKRVSTKADKPVVVPPKTPASSLNELLGRIERITAAGLLDLKKPASVLVAELDAADEYILSVAMDMLGYQQVYKTMSDETFYRKK
jgi:hypothetical protein